jgi:hypothetical protein
VLGRRESADRCARTDKFSNNLSLETDAVACRNGLFVSSPLVRAPRNEKTMSTKKKNEIPGISESDLPALVEGARMAVGGPDPLDDFIREVFSLGRPASDELSRVG